MQTYLISNLCYLVNTGAIVDYILISWWLSQAKDLSAVQETAKHRWPGFYPWVWKIPWRRKWQSIAVFLPGEYHGQRSLWAAVHGIATVRNDLETKPQPHSGILLKNSNTPFGIVVGIPWDNMGNALTTESGRLCLTDIPFAPYLG